MKKYILLTVVLFVLVLCSCATQTDITKRNADGSPVWTTEIPKSSRYFYGVGKAKLLVEANSQQAADAAARNDLALQISVRIRDSLAMYSNEASSSVTEAYETIILQSVNLTMKKVVVEQRWTAADGTVWSLVSFRAKNLPKLYSDAANDYLNQLEEKKITTQKKLSDLLEQLSYSTETGTQELKRLAQEKADSIVSEIKEITATLNVQNQVKAITEYLERNGFELKD